MFTLIYMCLLHIEQYHNKNKINLKKLNLIKWIDL